MKRICNLILVIVLGLSITLACGCNQPQEAPNKKLKVMTTIFPIYDWTGNILGNNNNIELELLIDNGVDMHSFQPTVEDIVAIKKSDLFIYIGGESDEWIEDILDDENNHTKVLNLMEVLGNMTTKEEIKEGMSVKSEDSEEESDEHIWLSLRNAMVCTRAIKDSLVSLDAEKADLYNMNYLKYRNELDSLDMYYSDMLGQAQRKEIVVADRFPFIYMTRDYGIEYYAAFPGCYADASASFETLFYLADRVDEGKLDTIFCTESSDETIPDAVEKITSGRQSIKRMDSMQSVSMEDIVNGANYLDIMEQNLQALFEACV